MYSYYMNDNNKLQYEDLCELDDESLKNYIDTLSLSDIYDYLDDLCDTMMIKLFDPDLKAGQVFYKYGRVIYHLEMKKSN